MLTVLVSVMPDAACSIILTGFMGAGKSSVGRVLSRLCGLPFIDLDAEIVADAGQSINQIFAEKGEDYFRGEEQRILNLLLARGPAVLATGGGAVLADENRRAMRSHGTIVNLQASLATVLSRLEGAKDRPLYAGHDPQARIKALMAAREQFYADADIRIDTNGKSVEDVAAEIIDKLRKLPA